MNLNSDIYLFAKMIQMISRLEDVKKGVNINLYYFYTWDCVQLNTAYVSIILKR